MHFFRSVGFSHLYFLSFLPPGFSLRCKIDRQKRYYGLEMRTKSGGQAGSSSDTSHTFYPLLGDSEGKREVKKHRSGVDWGKEDGLILLPDDRFFTLSDWLGVIEQPMGDLT